MILYSAQYTHWSLLLSCGNDGVYSWNVTHYERDRWQWTCTVLSFYKLTVVVVVVGPRIV